MESDDSTAARFGVFELDLVSGELRKSGVKVRLQEQPFQVLKAMVERPGRVVTREELQQRLWPDETFVDFEDGLSTAVRKIRQALGDSASSPRFIETLPKRGYRFIAPVDDGKEKVPGPQEQPEQPAPPTSPRWSRSQLQPTQGLLAAALLVAIVLGVILVTQGSVEPVERPVARFSFSPEGVQGAWISPDGKHILYAAGRGETTLWVRPLASESARELVGTEGVDEAFWSPDSLAIGFGTATELKRVALNGGDVVTLCKLPASGSAAFVGGSWSPDGQVIIFSSGLRLNEEVAAVGGDPKPLFDTGTGGGKLSLAPHFLPSGGGPQAIAYTIANTLMVEVMDLESGERRELVPGSDPEYSRVGYLLYSPPDYRDVGLRALPFSLKTLSTTGQAFPVDSSGHFPSVSRDGTLVYLDAPPNRSKILAWRDRAGNLLEMVGQPQQDMRNPSLSPDGRRVALVSSESGNQDVWVHDLVSATKARLTFQARRFFQPTWSPSGREVLYESRGDGGARVETKPVDGTGDAVVLIEGGRVLANPAWSPDGQYLVYQGPGQGTTKSDIHYLERQANGAASEPVTIVNTPATERVPKVSPDGRFLAYLSGESGRDEVYVRPFPSGTGRWQASVDGGTQPLWSRDGTELYYVDGLALMAVSVTLEPAFTHGQPQLLFESQDLHNRVVSLTYDVSADGQRFLTIAPFPDEDGPAPTIRVVENWYEEFRDRE